MLMEKISMLKAIRDDSVIDNHIFGFIVFLKIVI